MSVHENADDLCNHVSYTFCALCFSPQNFIVCSLFTARSDQSAERGVFHRTGQGPSHGRPGRPAAPRRLPALGAARARTPPGQEGRGENRPRQGQRQRRRQERLLRRPGHGWVPGPRVGAPRVEMQAAGARVVTGIMTIRDSMFRSSANFLRIRKRCPPSSNALLREV